MSNIKSRLGLPMSVEVLCFNYNLPNTISFPSQFLFKYTCPPFQIFQALEIQIKPTTKIVHHSPSWLMYIGDKYVKAQSFPFGTRGTIELGARALLTPGQGTHPSMWLLYPTPSTPTREHYKLRCPSLSQPPNLEQQF